MSCRIRVISTTSSKQILRLNGISFITFSILCFKTKHYIQILWIGKLKCVSVYVWTYVFRFRVYLCVCADLIYLTPREILFYESYGLPVENVFRIKIAFCAIYVLSTFYIIKKRLQRCVLSLQNVYRTGLRVRKISKTLTIIYST